MRPPTTRPRRRTRSGDGDDDPTTPAQPARSQVSDPDLAVRAWLRVPTFTAASLALGIVGHLWAGGAPPGPGTLALLVGAVGLISLRLADRERRLPELVLAVALVQAAVHVALLDRREAGCHGAPGRDDAGARRSRRWPWPGGCAAARPPSGPPAARLLHRLTGRFARPATPAAWVPRAGSERGSAGPARRPPPGRPDGARPTCGVTALRPGSARARAGRPVRARPCRRIAAPQGASIMRALPSITGRLAAASAVGAIVTLLLASPAGAHVTVAADDSTKGAEDAILTFRVPNEEDDAVTVKVDIKFPTQEPDRLGQARAQDGLDDHHEDRDVRPADQDRRRHDHRGRRGGHLHRDQPRERHPGRRLRGLPGARRPAAGRRQRRLPHRADLQQREDVQLGGAGDRPGEPAGQPDAGRSP